MNRITANQIDFVKNIECFDVAWLFSSRNLMDSVRNEKRFSDLADRLQKANTVSDRCSGVQNIHGAVLWFNYKQKYSMRNLSLMMKCSKKKERFDEAGRRYDIARSASVRYGGIQDVESTFSQLEGSYDEHMMLTENVGPDNSDEVVSCWISIPVTSLNQKEPERLIGLVDTVHRRAVSQDQVLYADLSSDNMTLVPDVNLQKHLMLQQVLVSDWRLGYSMSVFSSNQAVVQWFRIVQEFETDSGRNIRWLYIQFLACQNAFLNRNLLFQHKMEHQVVYTNKLWDPGGTAVARCLRVLWRHQEQWCWSRLHINDSYAMRCSGRESDYAAGTSKATDSVEDTSGFPKRDSQSTHEAGSVTMSREDCSAESLILEELIKTEDSLQEDFSNEKTRERKFKDLCFSQGMIMASAIAMRDEMVFSGKSWETLKLMKQLGCRSDDMLQKFCTEMWLIVTARWTCDQRLMAFYEAVQNSWFAGVVGASNGTDSFSIWHRWRYRPAIALCAEQEVDKLNENLPSDFISSTGHSVFAGNIKTVSEDLILLYHSDDSFAPSSLSNSISYDLLYKDNVKTHNMSICKTCEI
ncbi:hypothetical protein Bca52824_086006 [Brassica carinata]|uniref:Uncharacterized protein n=1 Tax=Brassica carinata TaxID=52824 RepID=A0A8X7P8U0_BRACI|nr:hypothetical protein Bca52824_086006 [Brassica carinata]